MATQAPIAVNRQKAAEIANVSVSVIQRACKAGEIPEHYVTSRPLILVEDLIAWIRSAPGEKA